MEHVINVEPRNDSGKGLARKLRNAGKVPGVLYGHKEPARPFAVDPKAVRHELERSGRGRNTVLKVTGLDREVLVLLKDSQIDPVKRTLLHVDLIEVRDTDIVEVEVPIKFVGKPAGALDGGILQPVRRELKIACTPLAIPSSIELDVSSLHIGDSIHIGDVKLGEGLTHVDPDHLTVVTLAAPTAVEEPTAEGEAAAAAEGEAAAAGEGAGEAKEEAKSE